MFNLIAQNEIFNFDVTRFHHGVSRCYCPSKEVAKRALVDGLGDSQIRVFGLPVRPSFPRTIIYKVNFVQIHST